jgi:hypothetical protein
MNKKLKASDLTWSGYGWWCRRPDGSRFIVHEQSNYKKDENR